MRLQLKYFQMYAHANKIDDTILFNRIVTNITFAEDHERSGRWRVFTQDCKTGRKTSDVFDGVMVCTGHHVLPLVPQFPGQERFSGQILHTHAFKHATPFLGKKVCVVGAGNSAIDAIVDLAPFASQVYMSTRRGVWVRPRVAHKGWPIETWLATRAVSCAMSSLPTSWSNSIMESFVNSRMDHAAYGLKPNHRILQQHPVTNDSLPNCILSGRVIVKRNIQQLTETGVIFEGESEETQVDVVILGTGYRKEIPFLDPGLLSAGQTNQAGGLYKYMFSPDLPHPHTIALIGIVHPLGPLHTASEMQARWFAALMSGRLRLPSRDHMRRVMDQERAFYQKAFYESSKHTLQLLYMPYMDELAAEIGCKPRLYKYLLTDPRLWFHVVFGLFSVYQYRLEGPFKWRGARDAIIGTNARILTPLRLVTGTAGSSSSAAGNSARQTVPVRNGSAVDTYIGERD